MYIHLIVSTLILAFCLFFKAVFILYNNIQGRDNMKTPMNIVIDTDMVPSFPSFVRPQLFAGHFSVSPVILGQV